MDKRTISVAKLLINTENPRFEAVQNQPEALALMLKEAGKAVLKLAEDIAKHGLNPSKSLIVVEEKGGHFLPVEGNRRVVALKLLHNPELASDKKLSEKFKELKKEYGSQIPNEVECVVFPDKTSAFRWVNLEHTGPNNGVGVLRWNSTQRQRFIALYAGKKLARSVQLFDFADENNLDHDKVDSTTLDRLVATPIVREQVGVNFPEGVLELVKPKGQVVKNLRKIFAEMSKKDFKVGDVYTETQRKTWIKEMLGEAEKSKEPDEKPKGTITKKEALDGDWINHQLYLAYPKQNRVKAILKELKDIHPKQKPNISAVSLRVLLELSVYILLKEKGHIAAIIKEEKQKLADENKKRIEKSKTTREWENDWSPSFQRNLDYMSKEESLVADPLERKTLKTFLGKKSVEPFITELNQFIHNPDYEPKPEAVIEIWEKLGKLLFRAILPQNNNENKN